MKFLAIVFAIFSALAPAVGSAQGYPSKPIKFIVAFGPGSGTDTLARILVEEIRKNTNAVIVVENKPGALGQIATEFVARSAPDGYTVMISSSATHSSGPHLVKKIAYDGVKDFAHVSKLNKFDVALVVNPVQGFKTLGELIAEAKKNPDKLTFGYGSATSQVIAESFNRAAGIQARGIPYKGQPLALNDLMGGQINFVAADLAVIQSHLKSGRIVALGIASDRRSLLLPAIPTLTELGIKEVELPGWTGVSGPAGMPRDVVSWWSNQMNSAFAKKDFVERMTNLGVETELMAPEPFGAFVKQQFEVWGKRIRDVGIAPE